MNLEKITAKVREANAIIPGKKIRIDFGGAGSILLDGVASSISNYADGDADTIVSVDWSDWEALATGMLDPMSAFMQGKLRIQGDMGLAMQLQTMFSKLRG